MTRVLVGTPAIDNYVKNVCAPTRHINLRSARPVQILTTKDTPETHEPLDEVALDCTDDMVIPKFEGKLQPKTGREIPDPRT